MGAHAQLTGQKVKRAKFFSTGKAELLLFRLRGIERLRKGAGVLIF